MGGVLARALLSMAAIVMAAIGDPAPAALAPTPPAACPARHDVEQEIDRLGVAAALALEGTPDVRVDDGAMQIVLRAPDGKVLGQREVAAPGACHERAVVAAVVIAAWLGEWSGRETPAPAPSPAPPPPLVLTGTPAPPTPAPRTPPRIDIAAFGFGVHDGDAGTWGAGGELGYRLSGPFSVIVLGQGTGERSQGLGPGRAAYSSSRFGAGLAWRRWFGRTLLDFGLAPEAARVALRGEQLPTTRAATTWSLTTDGRVRLGLRLGAAVPFVYADAAYAVATARLTLDDRPDQVTLSRWNLAAGLGLLFSFPPEFFPSRS